MKSALITGIAGFAGSHLVDFLLASNINVFGLYHPDHSVLNLEHVKDRISLMPVDLQNPKQVSQAVKDRKSVV